MADDTHTPRVSTEVEVRTVRWCHWHQDVAEDTTLIGGRQRNSGPPALVYACARCIEQYDLKPMGEGA